MSNILKYTTGSETLALKKDNFYIGLGDTSKGPTSSSGYYNGYDPPLGGYTIYLNKDNNGPSIYVANNDSELISLTNKISGQNFSTIYQCFTWFRNQTDKMVTNLNYESITTNGLVLNLDAGFIPSYSASGTSWYDVSTTGNNGTLVNGPTFNSSNYGSIVFDGSDDYCLCSSALNLTNSVTIEAWIYPINYPSGVEGGFILSNLGYYLEYGTDGKLKSYFYGLSSQGYHLSTSSVPLNAWSYVNVVRNKDNNTISFYINGVLDRTITGITGSIYSVGDGKPQIGGYTGSGYKFNGRISNVRVYNRALSGNEIYQNYTTMSSRFIKPNNLLILGAFTSPDDRIWSTNFSGGTNTNFTNNIGAGFNQFYPLNAYRYLNGTKILLCGFFTAYNGNTANYFVELNTDGTFSRTGIGTGFNNSVRFIGIQSDNKIICAGTFTSYNGVSCNRVVRLNTDFTIDGTFSIGTGIDNTVEGGVYDGTYVYLFGSFSTYNGVSCPKLAKIDSNGNLQSGVTTGFNGTWTHRGRILGDDIYIGGDSFTTYNGNSVPPRIVKLNKNTLTINTTFSTNYSSGLNARVGEIHSDENFLYIGGNFTNTPRAYLAKVSFDGVGQTFPSVAPSSNTYFFYPFDNNTKLAFGGNFIDYAGNSSRDRFAVVDASTGNVNTGWSISYFGGNQVPVSALEF